MAGGSGALRRWVVGVSPYLRKVRTASGATAVQVVDKSGGRRTILAHLGSFHDEAELAALMEIGRQRLHPGQQALDLERLTSPSGAGPVALAGRRSRRSCAPTRRPVEISLVLYDVSTLYFEIDKEDSLRKVGFSREQRVDPRSPLGCSPTAVASP